MSLYFRENLKQVTYYMVIFFLTSFLKIVQQDHPSKNSSPSLHGHSTSEFHRPYFRCLKLFCFPETLASNTTDSASNLNVVSSHCLMAQKPALIIWPLAIQSATAHPVMFLYTEEHDFLNPLSSLRPSQMLFLPPDTDSHPTHS